MSSPAAHRRGPHPRGRRALSRSALRGAAALLLVGAAGLGAPAMAALPAQGGAPNVLFVIADDLTAEALSVYGNAEVHTPNVERLAQRGMVFDRAYCQFPVCTASRASLMSGRYPDELAGANGSYSNLDAVLGADATMPEHFRLHGYVSERVSKIYHMRVPGDITNGVAGPDHAPSWNRTHNVQAPEWQTPGAAGHYTNETLNFTPGLHYGLGFGTAFYAIASSTSGAEQADWLAADEAVDRLGALQSSPFFLAVGFVRPHVPLVAPAAEFARYDAATLDLAESVPGDLSDIPPPGIFWNEPQRGPNSDADRRSVLQAYYASVSFMDAQLGRLLDRLDALGLADDTFVVFTSDHGYHLGEHTFWQKLSLHEESARVPLIIAGPGIAPGRTSSMAELVDLYPTLADLCGLDVPFGCSGESLGGVLADPSSRVREAAISQTGRGYLLRTGDRAFMRYSSGDEELYDMSPAPGGDPLQFTNLAVLPGHQAELQDLRSQLDGRIASFGAVPGSAGCFGNGTAGLCPCFNFTPDEEGCYASTGRGVRLDARGAASLSANSLRFRARGGPMGSFGLLFQGATPTAVQLGDGLLCTDITARLKIDLFDAGEEIVFRDLPAPAMAGTTTHYQVAFRDLAGPCSTGLNLSNAWMVTWTP